MNYRPQNIQAILFDMDGTLWDTEKVSERAIAELLVQWQVDVQSVDLLAFHGIKWSVIGQLLKEQFPALEGLDIAARIEEHFKEIQRANPAPLIPGAARAFRAASAALPHTTAIVTSSNAPTVEEFLDLADLREHCATFTSADMCPHSKPHPQSYLMTAERLGVEAGHCLVFEDSEAGMQAAAAAGMHCIAITGGHEGRTHVAERLAHATITDFTELADNFFGDVVQIA